MTLHISKDDFRFYTNSNLFIISDLLHVRASLELKIRRGRIQIIQCQPPQLLQRYIIPSPVVFATSSTLSSAPPSFHEGCCMTATLIRPPHRHDLLPFSPPGATERSRVRFPVCYWTLIFIAPRLCQTLSSFLPDNTHRIRSGFGSQ